MEFFPSLLYLRRTSLSLVSPYPVSRISSPGCAAVLYHSWSFDIISPLSAVYPGDHQRHTRSIKKEERNKGNKRKERERKKPPLPPLPPCVPTPINTHTSGGRTHSVVDNVLLRRRGPAVAGVADAEPLPEALLYDIPERPGNGVLLRP